MARLNQARCRAPVGEAVNMRERPILFSGPMVRAILAGTKTQTRRAIKRPLRHPGWTSYVYFGPSTNNPTCRSKAIECGPDYGDDESDVVYCPYGAAGDRLWCRETGWERPERTPKMMREGADTWERYYYDADGLSETDHEEFKAWGFKRRPSIFMPRWASRISLEITGVRVQRLQDISDADCLAEGIEWPYPSRATPRGAYRSVWEAINGAKSWAATPWVWVIEFKRIDPLSSPEQVKAEQEA